MPTFAAGDRLGPYEILAPLGAGGMGEVWKARDTRLGRDVAIKVSHEKFSDRFEREARAIAILNHPNICQLYDVGASIDGLGYLVMELIEGPTLAERIKQGAIPLEESLNVARQIAAALDAAHQKGIVHRDLKPANIKVSENGNVKVLDFGLALVGLGVAPASAGDPNPSNSPTLTELTRPGMILGTASYMSPEQARGKAVDKRADIWAFGVVLYEMVTGKSLFKGEDVSETLAAVIKQDPDLSAVPFEIQRVLQSCLEKDPNKRLRDIGDAWRLLGAEADEGVRRGPGGPPHKRWLWPSIAAVLAVVLTVVGIVGWRPGSGGNQQPSMTLAIVPPAGVTLLEVGNQDSAPELSPDGTSVMYYAGSRLYIRRLDSPVPRPVPGSEAASNAAFWSPDSTTIVFPVASSRQLMKVRIPDGAPEVIAQLDVPSRGGGWSDAGTILISAQPDLLAGRAAGGELNAVEMPAFLKEGSCYYPEFLPGGEDFLVEFVPSANPDDAAVYWATLRDGKATDAVRLLKNQTAARYTPAGGGRILFVRNDNLYSQKLNRGTRKLEDEAELVAQGVSSQPSGSIHRADFSVAGNGTVAWRPGKAAVSQLTVFDRQGTPVGTAGPPGSYTSVALSPDEKQLLLVSSDGSWLADVGQPGRLGLPRGVFWFGWFAGGSKLIGGHQGAYMEMSASGLGAVRETGFGTRSGTRDISPDGKRMIGTANGGIFSLQLEGSPEETKPRMIVEKAAQAFGPRFAPDVRWFVYEDKASGGLYVQPFPGPGPRRQIAPSGGKAAWRKDGKEIVYFDQPAVMSVTVETVGSELRFGAPRKLFSGLRVPPGMNASSGPLAVSRDGSRIFWLQGVEQPDSNMIYIKTGWVR